MCGRAGHISAAPPAQGETTDAHSDMPKPVRILMREAAGRSWKHLVDERIEGVEPVIPIGKRFWALTTEEQEAVGALFATDALRRLARSLRSRDDDAEVRVMDAAYRRKGCSPLGRLRVAVLVATGTGKNERHCLMDVKEAIAATAPHYTAAARADDNAERVVAGARFVTVSGEPHVGCPVAGQDRVYPRIAATGPEAGDRTAVARRGFGCGCFPGPMWLAVVTRGR